MQLTINFPPTTRIKLLSRNNLQFTYLLEARLTMASSKGLKLSSTLYFSFATVGLIIAVLGLLFPGIYDSTSGRVGFSLTIPKSVQKYLSIIPSHEDHHKYRAQVFSRDPLVMYIHDFLTPEEIDYVLEYRYV